MKVIGLTGYAGVGKDTVADLIQEMVPDYDRGGGVDIVAFADALREEVCCSFDVPIEMLTWSSTKHLPCSWLSADRCKNEEFLAWLREASPMYYDELSVGMSPRRLLQLWGTEYRRAQDANWWTSQVAEAAGRARDLYGCAYFVIPDVRFPDEAALVRKLGGAIIRITRPGVGPANSHVSEHHEIEYDGTIDNNGTIEQLAEAIDGCLAYLDRKFFTK